MGVHKTRSLTVMVVGGHSEPVRRVRLPRRTLVAGAVGLASILAVAGGTLYDYLSLLGHAAENRSLGRENAALSSELALVEGRVAGIQKTVERIEHFDAKLRAAATPHAPERALAVGPLEPGVSPPPGPPAAREDLAALPVRLLSLAAEASRQERSLRELLEYFDDRETLLASTPSVWPARGWVTSDFGGRPDPYTGERKKHEGIDIASSVGQPVYAPSDGTVVFAGLEGSYGKVLVIDHGFGVKTRYGHLSEIVVRLGDRVARGTKVAAVGNTGRSTGPHLHYEVRVNGIPENPRKFILE
jgi:murein DD-endopeptidase MepM/ murein hydrolase activator NlpD